MTYSHATFEYSGISIDGFVTEDGTSYITLTSIGEGLGISRKNIQNWLQNHNQKSEGIAVAIGIRNKAATAYPISTIVRFLDYRVGLGDKQASAFVLAGLGTDLDTANKEANLITVTPAQREVTRVGLRMDLITKWVAGYETNPAVKVALYTEATPAEKEIVTCRVTIARLETTIERMWVEGKGHPLAMQVIKDYEAQIVHTKARLEAQGVSC